MPTTDKPQESGRTPARSSSVPGLPAFTTVAIALSVSVMITIIAMLATFGLYRWRPHYLQARDMMGVTVFGNAVVHASVEEKDINVGTVQNVQGGGGAHPLDNLDLLLENLAARKPQRSFHPELRFRFSERSNALGTVPPLLAASLAGYPADGLMHLAAAALAPERAEEQQRALLIDLVRETAIRNGISPSALSVEAVRPSESKGKTTTRLMAILSGHVSPDMLYQAVSRTVRGKDVVTDQEAVSGQKALIKVYFQDALCVELLCITPVPFGTKSPESMQVRAPEKAMAVQPRSVKPTKAQEEPAVLPMTEKASARPKAEPEKSQPAPKVDPAQQVAKDLTPPLQSATDSALPEQTSVTPAPAGLSSATPSEPEDMETYGQSLPPASAPKPEPAATPAPPDQLLTDKDAGTAALAHVKAAPALEPVALPAESASLAPDQDPVLQEPDTIEAFPVVLEAAPVLPEVPVPPGEMTKAAENPLPQESAVVEAPVVTQEAVQILPEVPAPPGETTEAAENPLPQESAVVEAPVVIQEAVPVFPEASVPSQTTVTSAVEVVQPEAQGEAAGEEAVDTPEGPLALPETESEITPDESPAEDAKIVLARNVVPVETYPPAPEEETAEGEGEAVKAYLGIILDDGGYGGDEMTRVMELDNRLTLAILPDTPFASETVQLAVAKGFEIMVHMPMQAGLGAKNRFPGELNVNMTREQVRQRTQECLDQFPEAVGVNNHTGGLFTRYPENMGWFLEVVKAEQMYFVDSRTVGSSCAYDKAVEAGIPAARRDLFLDHSNTISDIRKRFNELVDIAKRQGSAVGIGHFRPNTITVLAEKLPGLAAQGIELVPVSELVW